MLRHAAWACETHMLSRAGCFGPEAARSADVVFVEDACLLLPGLPFEYASALAAYRRQIGLTKHCSAASLLRRARTCTRQCVRCIVRVPCVRTILHTILRHFASRTQ